MFRRRSPVPRSSGRTATANRFVSVSTMRSSVSSPSSSAARSGLPACSPSSMSCRRSRWPSPSGSVSGTATISASRSVSWSPSCSSSTSCFSRSPSWARCSIRPRPLSPAGGRSCGCSTCRSRSPNPPREWRRQPVRSRSNSTGSGFRTARAHRCFATCRSPSRPSRSWPSSVRRVPARPRAPDS